MQELIKVRKSAICWLHDKRESYTGYFVPPHSNLKQEVLLEILSDIREEPIPNTDATFVELYQKCWEHESDNDQIFAK
ncbi:kinase-like domain-containing protein [Rhizophagus clarus]|uniref:Kinase-like domain-containing protein n=1 Tax=Rhizophagus clarus TaxID=94130 RepID=A0A8H3M1Q0_9GLOM|nr:kinase-like domain-containing protein [Rhizophagus clarus]